MSTRATTLLPVRKSIASGLFYPSNKSELSAAIADCYMHRLGPRIMPPATAGKARIISVIAPHAGYKYSGPVAAHSYMHISSLIDPDLIIIIAPNHSGIGSGVSTFKEGEWETPFGRMKVDAEAAAELVKASGIAVFDQEAHATEHSIEVQLPFLQQIYGNSIPFLPISLILQDLDTSKVIANSIVKVIGTKKAVIIASSDLTHYEPADEAKMKDSSLLECITKMDPIAFYSTLNLLNVTACGFGPIAAVMQASTALGLQRGEILKYANSGDTSGDYGKVVGYGAVRFV